jgi:protein SCO1/2
MDKKTLLVGLGSFLLILTVGVGVFLFATPPSFRGTTYDKPYPAAPEFVLTRSDGSSFQLSEMRGKVVLLFFGYTSCPDVCPTTMAELKQVVSELAPKETDQVKVLFVTVDPKRDTPERVQTYVGRFNPAFIGLSGTEAQLDKVWQAYGVYRLDVPGSSPDNYSVDHTARITMIDRDGNMRVSFGFDAPVEDLVHDLELLLQ